MPALTNTLSVGGVVALLLCGCTVADLKGYQDQAEKVTIDAVTMSAAQAQLHRLESEQLRWELMKEVADELAEMGYPLAAVEVLDCYYHSRQPLYLTRVIEWLATIDGELDGEPVERPYPAQARPWECALPDLQERTPIG